MKRMWPIISLAVAMGCCSWARASEPKITPTHCEKRGPDKELALSNKDLVLCGIAAPDDVLFRAPKGIDVDPFFNKIWRHFGGRDDRVPVQDRRPWTQISPGLWAFHLPSERWTPLTQKAETVDEVLLLLDAAKGIRMGPPIVIPDLLEKIGIVSEDIRSHPEGLSQSSPTTASATASLLDWTTSNAEPDLYLVGLATPAPRDPGYTQQCGLKAIHAEEAWQTITEAPNVKIAIVDSGVDETHPDLTGNAAPASPRDDVDVNGHGTHLAGIIGGIQDDKIGIVGVTWKTKITAYRFLDASGRGTLKEAIPKIEQAISGSPRIILLAWGVAKGSPELNAVLLKAKANEILLVAAAGNSGQDTAEHRIYPASYPLDNLISVMATTCDDVRPRFSNFGQYTVDLAAPGEGLSNNLRIYSSVLHHQWGHLAGTSMSAAFVAGAAALVFEKNPTATPQQVKCWLNLNVDQIPGLENKSGGRLNLAKTVKPLAKCP